MVNLQNIKDCVQALRPGSQTATEHFDWQWARLVEAGETTKAEQLATWYQAATN